MQKRKNEVFLGKTGASEKVGGDLVKGGQLERAEFIAENMQIYDNDGNPHYITEKFAVSATIEYLENSSGDIISYQDPNGITGYSWVMKDIRIDAVEDGKSKIKPQK